MSFNWNCFLVLIERSKSNFELEYANLNYQLHLSQNLIKESTEAGDVLLDDLSNIKKQVKSENFAINWNKFKVSTYFNMQFVSL